MTRRTILVVDEEHETALAVRQALGATCEVVSVFSRAEAFEELEHKTVALALIAQNLPEANGLELLAEIKAQRPGLPLILVAESLEGKILLAAFRAGCCEALPKPLEEAEVAERLQRVLDTLPEQRPQGLRQMPARLKQLFATRSHTRAQSRNSEHAPHHEASTPHENTVPSVAVNFYGEFRVCVNEQQVATWPSRKSKLLFAYLAMNHKRRVSREVLMETFWPNAEPEAARNSLNVALYHIRRALQEIFPGYDFIFFKDDCYFFNPELEIALDVEEFKRHWKRAQCLERESGREAALPEYEQAANLYLGDFMEDEVYESWASSQREHFKEIYLLALDRISKAYSLNGKPDLAVNLCERILSLDNCREDAHRRLMLCYYRLGKRDKALKQFKKCEEVLQAELEVKPTRATFELHERIKNGEHAKKKNSFSKI